MEDAEIYPRHQMKYWVLIKSVWGGQDRESQKVRRVFKEQSVIFLNSMKTKVSEGEEDLQLDLWWCTLRSSTPEKQSGNICRFGVQL